MLGTNLCVKKEKMKTTICKIMAFALTIALVLSLASCFGGVDESGKCTVVISDGERYEEYAVELGQVEGDDGLMAVLRYLNEKEGIYLNATDGQYGVMLWGVGECVPDMSAREYIKIFTSNEADFDTSTMFELTEYEGTRLGTAGVGASSMTVTDGCVFLITIGTY